MGIPLYLQVIRIILANAHQTVILLRWVEQSLERLASCRLPRVWIRRIQIPGSLRAAAEKLSPFLYALGDLVFMVLSCALYVLFWRALWL